jgi:threonine dehydratase
LISLDDISRARRAIADHVLETPLLRSAALSEAAGCELWLKLECRQHTGSFKPRGALNKILSLSDAERARGIVAASAGNHALGVAHACRVLSLPSADVFVQANAAPAKIAKLRRYPVRLHLVGDTYEAAQQAALQHAQASGAVFVPAYDDEVVAAGQGTAGLEIMDALPDCDAVVIPVGGGALMAGIAVAVKARRPQARVVGVNPEASPSAKLSFERGEALDPYDHEPTLAQGLAGGFGRVPFAIARSLVDEIALVSESELARGIAALIDAEQVLAEASGIAAVAACLYGRTSGLSGKRVVAVVSGGNIDVATLRAVLDRALG